MSDDLYHAGEVVFGLLFLAVPILLAYYLSPLVGVAWVVGLAIGTQITFRS